MCIQDKYDNKYENQANGYTRCVCTVRIVEKRFLFILYIQQPAGNFQCTAPWLHYTFSSLVSSCTDVPRTNETELTEKERERARKFNRLM